MCGICLQRLDPRGGGCGLLEGKTNDIYMYLYVWKSLCFNWKQSAAGPNASLHGGVVKVCVYIYSGVLIAFMLTCKEVEVRQGLGSSS